MNMGVAWGERYEDVWGQGSERRRPRRATRLVGAAVASASVFRALLRRPDGGTVVVLVPRVAAAPGRDAIVIDDQLRDAS
ncbi:MAG TPA: hypothetical protein VIE12_03825 [Actinomycetota bacterium]|jgi:hypothetical protein